MALPKLNDTPKYNMTIPSTRQEVRFRPFLVKEEKVMLIALESDDQKQQLNSIVDTLSACIETDIDYDTLTTFDVEYMFNQLRAKSVGETAKISLQCTDEECKADNEVVINVDSMNVEMPDVDYVIELDDNISIEMLYPSYKNVMESATGKMTETEQMFNVMKQCLRAVITEEERIDLKNESPKEIESFIESMDSRQFGKIRKFLEEMPQMKHPVEFACKMCGKEHKEELSGIQNFF